MGEKEIVGIVEEIQIIGVKKIKTLALFDSGAHLTSVDMRLASKAQLGPIVGTMIVKNPSVQSEVRRILVKAQIKIKDKIFDVKVNLQDRSHMSMPVIIGRNILSGNFIVDPYKNQDLLKKKIEDFPEKSIESWIKTEEGVNSVTK